MYHRLTRNLASNCELVDEDANESRPHCLPPSSFPERDLRDGGELRFKAYRVAWKKCLDRMQVIITTSTCSVS